MALTQATDTDTVCAALIQAADTDTDCVVSARVCLYLCRMVCSGAPVTPDTEPYHAARSPPIHIRAGSSGPAARFRYRAGRNRNRAGFR